MKDTLKKIKNISHTLTGVFTMHITNIGLISRLYEKFKQFNRKLDKRLAQKRQHIWPIIM